VTRGKIATGEGSGDAPKEGNGRVGGTGRFDVGAVTEVGRYHCFRLPGTGPVVMRNISQQKQPETLSVQAVSYFNSVN
jgi:hypothetical protein